VADARVERSQPAGVFDAAALQAAKAWKFTPVVKDGRAVPARIRVPVHFEPDERQDASGGMG
jgi:TonB family protein